MVIVPFFWTYYLKKEDARAVAKWQRIMAATLLICSAIVIGIMQLFVVPKFISLYEELNYQVPATAQMSFMLTIVVVIISLSLACYFLLSKPNYSRVDAILSKYKDGEMVKTTELMDKKYFLFLLFPLVVILYSIFAIILPIYNLTSQLQ